MKTPMQAAVVEQFGKPLVLKDVDCIVTAPVQPSARGDVPSRAVLAFSQTLARTRYTSAPVV